MKNKHGSVICRDPSLNPHLYLKVIYTETIQGFLRVIYLTEEYAWII